MPEWGAVNVIQVPGPLAALVTTVDNKDAYTSRHCLDVSCHARRLALALGMDAQEVETVRVAGLLHDVGKIGVPDSVLRKHGPLTAEEMLTMRQHPQLGAAIVGGFVGLYPELAGCLDAIRFHHERPDGRGYPFGLAGEEIPLTARLMAVADGYSAMTTDRPYREGMCPLRARAILSEGAGTQWDDRCVSVFVGMFEQ